MNEKGLSIVNYFVMDQKFQWGHLKHESAVEFAKVLSLLEGKFVYIEKREIEKMGMKI